ncbi:hypothetical protein FS837_011704 [Tulasnella sp. UAMH 9824]|nr:hypothetical protein FS837_011704 [Tulasnella sp. UAMH 9824]
MSEIDLILSSTTSSESQTPTEPYIEQLPVELLAKVLLLALPLPDTNGLAYPNACTDYMRSLYKLRLVSRTWKEFVDSTPGLWALVSWEFPDHLNISNMVKSRNEPLVVGCSRRTKWGEEPVSCLRFLQLVEPARHRWQVVWLDYVLPEGLSSYFADPAPMVEAIHLRYTLDSPHHEAFPLFGHHVSNIRYVNLTYNTLHPSPSPFRNLTSFSLCPLWGGGVAIEWITEVLRASPQLERFCLTNLELQIPASSLPIEAIDLPYLNGLRLYEIDGRAIDYIMRLINAPNCTQLQVYCIGRDADDYDPSLLLDSGLTPFEPIIQNIMSTMLAPLVSIDADSIEWGDYTPPDWDSDRTQFCHLYIRRASFLAIIRWVERVVESTRLSSGPGWSCVGSFNISSTALLENAEMASRLKHFKSITSIVATEPTVDVAQLLQLLGEAGPEPWFPCLQNLTVHAYGWKAQQLLEMLRTRSSRSSQPVLRLVMIKSGFWVDFAGRGKQVVFDSDIWREIRAIKELHVDYPGGEDKRADRKVGTHRRIERSPLQEFIYSASFLPVLAFAFGIYIILLTS